MNEQRYEYRSVRVNSALSYDEKVQATIDEAAKEGWRLVVVQSNGGTATSGLLIFERPTWNPN
jgi:hypothetical protein